MRISDWSSDGCSSDLLDTETRQRLAGELRGLLRASGATVLMVTHDQGEAFAMADHVGVMDGGRILQWDTPAGLYARPAHRYVAGFVGRGELVLPGQNRKGVGLGRGVSVRLNLGGGR